MRGRKPNSTLDERLAATFDKAEAFDAVLVIVKPFLPKRRRRQPASKLVAVREHERTAPAPRGRRSAKNLLAGVTTDGA